MMDFVFLFWKMDSQDAALFANVSGERCQMDSKRIEARLKEVYFLYPTEIVILSSKKTSTDFALFRTQSTYNFEIGR